MNNLPMVFEQYASEILARHPEVRAKWEVTKTGGRRLMIYKQDESGFDVIVDAETHGLYPYADEWHGPAWDLNGNCEELCQEFMGFIRSLLCEDSRLEVSYAGSRPYKFVLTFPTEGGFESSETGLFFFDYFGKRSARIFQNRHLPPRYK
jgi:hypothetical protein